MNEEAWVLQAALEVSKASLPSLRFLMKMQSCVKLRHLLQSEIFSVGHYRLEECDECAWKYNVV